MPGPLSANTWINDIRVRLRDNAGSNNTWSRLEVLQAIIDGQREARGFFWVEGVYQSLTANSNRQIYPLPPYIRRINRIERSLSGTTIGDIGPWQTVRDWNHVADQQTNYLIIGRPIVPAVYNARENRYISGEHFGIAYYRPAQYRVYYEKDLPVFPIEDTLTTSVTETAQVIPLSNSNSPMYTWPKPGYFQIGNEILYYEAVTLTSFTNVQRGMFDTGVVTNTMPFGLRQNSQTIISPVWVENNDGAVDFITHKAMQRLLMQRLLDGDTEGNRVVASLAAEYGTMAMEKRNTYQRRHQLRTITMKRAMR